MNLLVTIATGQRKYGDMALSLCISAKANDDEQQTCLIYTDSAVREIEPLIEQYFDYTIRVSDEENPIQQAFTLKTKLYDILNKAEISYDAAIFIDADSLILPDKKVSLWFDELNGKKWTCYCNDIYDYKTKKRLREDYTFWCEPEKIGEWCNGLEVTDQFANKVPHSIKSMPQLNTSFIYWEDCATANRVFEMATAVMNEDGKFDYQKYKDCKPDELCFNIACAVLNVMPHQQTYRPLFMQSFSSSYSLEYILHQYNGISFGGNGKHPEYLIGFYNRLISYYREYNGIRLPFAFVQSSANPRVEEMNILPVNVKTLYRRGEVPNSNGGIFNPSAFTTSENIELTIFRMEQSHNPLKGYMNESAIPFVRVGYNGVYEETQLELKGFSNGCRVEDFRLFGHKNIVYCSHTVIEKNLRKGMVARIGLSQVLEKTLKLNFLVDLPIQQKAVEKNWLFFFDNEDMYCIYSLEPYILFKFDNNEWFSVPKNQPKFNWKHEGFICNSTHPILINDFYLVLFHTKENSVYFHGACLLDKQTKEIVHISKKCIPIKTCNEGIQPGLNYVSGAQYLKDKNIIRLFIGEGDSHSVYNDFNASELINAIIFEE